MTVPVALDDPRLLEVLRHTVGLNRRPEPYRNYFMAAPGSPDEALCLVLSERGLMFEASVPEAYRGLVPDRLFRVSDAGFRVLGLVPPGSRLFS